MAAVHLIESRQAAQEEEEQKARDRRRLEWLALLLLMQFNLLEEDLHMTARDFGAGAITAEEFGDEVFAHLKVSHAQAAYIGRRRAGITGPMDADDLEFGLEAAEHEEEFLQGFVEDLRGDRYHEPGPTGREQIVNVKAIERRLTQYAMGLAGTANEAWVEAMPDSTRYIWRDVKDEAECDDCRANARKGPFTRETLPGIPGDGRTRCKRNCRCELITTDGERSFDLRHLFDGEKLIDG